MRFRTIGTRRADQGVRLRPLVWALVMVSGFIFFCYNDYRTHIRDKGTGVMKQRIHGVVDLFGARKHSYEIPRLESSPVETLEYHGTPSLFTIWLRTRNSVPAYTLNGYKLRGILYGYGDIPPAAARG